MARLSDLVNNRISTKEVFESETVETTEVVKETLVEALETLIEMVKEDELTEDELQMLEDTVEFITKNSDDVEEDSEEEDSEEEELTEKRMSAKAKMYARKYRLKNRAKLKMIAKKKKKCLVKIAGKTDKLTCNSKGQIKRIDKKRSRAAKIGARSR